MPKKPQEQQQVNLPTPPGMNPRNTPVTPEEQQAYQQLELNAMKILFSDPKVTDKLFAQMEELAEEPSKAVAMGTKMVMDGAKKHTKNKNLSPEMMTRVTATVVDKVGNLANTSGLFQIDNDGKKQAMQFVLGSGIKEALAGGQINPDSVLNFAAGHMKRANKMMQGQQGGTEDGQ